MTAAVTTPQNTNEQSTIEARPAATRSRRQVAGVVVSVLVGAFLVFDIVGKLLRPDAVIEGTQNLGFPVGQTYVMGVVLLACVVVYAIPRTVVLGALGITAYLGGAVTANMRIEAPLLTTTLAAVYFGIFMWIGLVLRRPELLKVAGLRR